MSKKEWLLKYRSEIKTWLRKHPPPVDWQSNDIEWAYLEMPDPSTWFGSFLLWIGI
jgi:hypothetical protein